MIVSNRLVLSAAQTWDFTLPLDLEDGEYLLRSEILGLHAAGVFVFHILRIIFFD